MTESNIQNAPDIATFLSYQYNRNIGLTPENMETLGFKHIEFYEELYQDKNKQNLWAMEGYEV